MQIIKYLLPKKENKYEAPDSEFSESPSDDASEEIESAYPV